MSDYIVAYYVEGEPKIPSDGPKHMEKFKEWIGSLGDAAVNPGTPLRMSVKITSDGVSNETGPSRLTGYSIVSAQNIALDNSR